MSSQLNVFRQSQSADGRVMFFQDAKGWHYKLLNIDLHLLTKLAATGLSLNAVNGASTVDYSSRKQAQIELDIAFTNLEMIPPTHQIETRNIYCFKDFSDLEVSKCNNNRDWKIVYLDTQAFVSYEKHLKLCLFDTRQAALSAARAWLEQEQLVPLRASVY